MSLEAEQMQILSIINNGISSDEKIAAKLNLDIDLVTHYMEELEKVGYLTCVKSSMFFQAPRCAHATITPKGKTAIRTPDKVIHSNLGKMESTIYNLQNSKFGGGFAAEGGTQIGGTLNDYSVTIANNLDDIERLLNTISEMVARFPEQQREEAQVDLDDLAEAIETPEKHNPTRFRKLLNGLLAAGMAAGNFVGGAAAFSENLNDTAVNFGEFRENIVEIGEKLGVTIDVPSQPTP